jgi:hypothetical protein
MESEFQKSPRWNLTENEVSSVPNDRCVALPCAARLFDPSAWDYEKIKERFPDLATTNIASNCSYAYKTNCYAYALGDASLFLHRLSGWTDPGVIAGRRLERTCDIHLSHIMQLAENDGLRPTGNQIILEKDSRPVALFIREYHDYHWLRLDSTGNASEIVWSHKYRNSIPQIVRDDAGSPVLDPSMIEIIRPGMTAYKFACFFNVPTDLAIAPEIVARQPRNEPQRLLKRERQAQRPDSCILIPQLG